MMSLRSSNRLTLIVTVAVVTLFSLMVILSARTEAAPPQKPYDVLTVDIAQNMATFVADEAPLHEDGMPAYGNPFVIEGFIYPEGTLDESNGIVIRQDEDGNTVVEPEFPDKVIGKWTCRGWFVGDGLHSTDQPWAVTTQLFDLGEGYGARTIVSDGYEIPFGLDASVHRAITGGTGDYAGARGEQVQWLVGLNATDAANFRIELQIDKR